MPYLRNRDLNTDALFHHTLTLNTSSFVGDTDDTASGSREIDISREFPCLVDPPEV